MAENTEFIRFTNKNITLNAIVVFACLLWSYFTGGIRAEYYYLVLIWLTGYYFTEKTRRFILAFSIFIIYWIVYDSMRVIPNYQVSQVHIKQPYELEKLLFGINETGHILTPNEYFNIHSKPFLDILAGLFYINWVPIPLAFAVYLYFKDKYLFTKFSLVFLLVNLVGFVIYYIYPAAPPWYVKLYGFDLHLGVPGNSAGLARFDAITGIPVFQSIYNKNANVLAAIPSLHAAYPVIVLYYGIKKGLKIMNWFFAVFMLGIWFSAVYSGHHYLVDIGLGVTVALVVIVVFEKLSLNPFVNNKIQRFIKLI
jgi:hypothetical protein